MITSATLLACGGGGGGGGGGAAPTPTPPPVTVVSAPTGSPITSFTQSVVSNDTGTFSEVFPGQANLWTLDMNFDLVDGFDDQFAYAIDLSVGSGSSAVPFPSDQVYSELTFTGPFMGASDGIKVAAVSDGASMASNIAALGMTPLTLPLAGTHSAFLNATSDSRLQQKVDLTSATGTVQVSWRYAVSLDAGAIPGYTPSFNVVVRNVDGTVCETLFGPITTASSIQVKSLIPSCTGKTIVLSFEEKGMTNPFSQAYAVIDDVSIKDSNGTGAERVTNGDFENGLTGWTTNTPVEAQNVTSGGRSIEGLDVKRSFYTVPNKLWGRWVDTFENHTAATIATPVTYETSLDLNGNSSLTDGCEIIYNSNNSTGTTSLPSALTAWDIQGNRDVGLVFGNASGVIYTSNTGTICNGSDVIDVTYNISVPAGGMVAIVNFVIMDGTDTGADPNNVTVDSNGFITSVNIAAKAADIDTEAAKITANFWTDSQYQAGMTPAQIGAIQNFSH